ncbi:MAG: HigA family addiction module antitoxin [Bosea sp. (in: a-proteobacteria)]
MPKQPPANEPAAARADHAHPGEILLEDFMKPLGISQNRLARDLDVPVSRVADLVAGNRAITGDTALRLARFFGTTPELWMNLQTEHELELARRLRGDDIEMRVRKLVD